LHVRNSQAFEQSGTVIFAGAAAPGAKSITLKRNLTSVQVTPALAGDDALFVELVCHATARHREDLDLCLISHAGALFIAGDAAAASIAAEVETNATVSVERHRALVTIVGERMDTDAASHTRLLRALEQANVAAIVHGASTTGRSFVVEEAHAAAAIVHLHHELFET
jgi:aspartokinase